MQRQVFLSGDTVELIILVEADAPALQPWINDPNINQYLSRGSEPMTLEAEEEFLSGAYKKSNQLILGIWHKTDRKLIGITGWHQIDQLNQTASFGIIIGEPDYHSQGIGTEVLNLMLDYAFRVRNLRSVRLSVLSNNPRGQRCYEKCGFEVVGTYPKYVYKQGDWHDEVIMLAKNPLYA